MRDNKERKERQKKRRDRRHRRLYALAAPLADAVFSSRLTYSHEDPPVENISGPILICFNHSCVYDPVLIGVAFRKRRLSFIASEHILRTKPWGEMISKRVPIIPHSKGAGSNRTALMAIKRIRRGESVFLAHEGEQTWDGVSMDIMPLTGKLVKSSGATLVTYRVEGAYLARPRWATNDRNGVVTGHVAGIYSPSELAEMSESEIEDIIERDTFFDVWEWQKNRPGGPLSFTPIRGGSADGIERAVFTCPSCGGISTLTSDGDDVRCPCGFKIRMKDTGFFEQPAPFETVADWIAHDREALRERVRDIDGELFGDSGVSLYRINDDHTDEKLIEGRLSFRSSDEGLKLALGTFSVPLSEIREMKMVLASRLLFSYEKGYYELRTDAKSKVNLYKYLIARELLSETGDK